MTASTMFMDVVTNFAPAGARPVTRPRPTASSAGPVRLRNALQFSLNIPAIKAGFINGLEHQFERTKDFGLAMPSSRAPVASMSIGTLEIHPIDMISAYGMIANDGVLMPRHTILKVLDDEGKQVWPPADTQDQRRARRVAARRPTSSPTSWPATRSRRVNPFWGEWKVTDGVTGQPVRPAAYKTGTTSDNRTSTPTATSRRPRTRSSPALVAGVWMGNSDNSPNDGKLSLDTSAPLWSAILSDVSKGMPDRGLRRGPGRRAS